MIEQPKFTYFPLGKACEKQIKAIEYQGEKQIKALEEHGKQLVKSDDEKDSLKAHRQISKKRCFGKYCSCDQACQFSALQGTP